MDKNQTKQLVKEYLSEVKNYWRRNKEAKEVVKNLEETIKNFDYLDWSKNYDNGF